jgi:hypothetical protein
MRRGPDLKRANEVFDLLTVDHLMSGLVYGVIAIENVQFEAIEDIAEARRLATEQTLESEGYENWSDLGDLYAEQFSVPESYPFEEYETVRRELYELASLRVDGLRSAMAVGADGITDWHLRPTHREVACECIMNDLFYMALARLQFGITYEFFETMFSAYKQGGWPCGWKGAYPEGKMVVYHIGPKV